MNKYRVYICVGPNCGPKGSAGLVGMLEDELSRLGLTQVVSVTAGGCQSHCLTGPTMVVYPGPTFYQGLSRERLTRIATEHLLGDKPVTEFFWDGRYGKIEPKRNLKEIPHTDKATSSGEHNAANRPKSRPKKIYDVDDFKW